jgi:hypothetical protein
MGRFFLSITLLSVLFLPSVSGCAGRTRQPPLPPDGITAERLTALLREQEGAIQTMKGLFRVQIQGPGIPVTQRAEGAMFYRRPDRLRLQGFTRLGGALFEFLLGTDRYVLKLASGQVLAGRTSELERIGQVAQPFKLSVLAMSGVTGIQSVAEDERAVMAVDGDRYRLDVFRASQTDHPFRRLWFDRSSLHIVQEERLSPSGEVEATVQFDDYRPIGLPTGTEPTPISHDAATPALVKPFRITAQDGSGKGIIMLTFQEMAPNVALKPEELQVTRNLFPPNIGYPAHVCNAV